MKLPNNLWEDLIHLFYPNLCIACQSEAVRGEEILCILCESELTITDLHKFEENEFTRRLQALNFCFGSAMFRFYPGGRVQKMVHAIKYRHHTRGAIKLGRRYGELLTTLPSLQDLDVIVPIPLHKKRFRQRGYNQSAFFAQGLADSFGIPFLSNAIVRTKQTTTQTEKSRHERLLNMSGAFSYTSKIDLTNKHVLIVDDVLTTGATLESCASSIMDLPGVTISFATIAIAE